jgi:hypothetical protein
MTLPLTPIYGLPMENATTQPAASLSGGSSGTEPILAEKVENQMVRIDDDIATLQTAVAHGWVPIDAGTESGVDTFDIDPTAGGLYPAGTFALMRLYLRGSTDGDSYVTLRVNDSVADSHRRGWVTFRTDTGAAVDSGHGDATNARIADWSSVFGNNCQVTIFNTDISSHVSWEADAGRIASSGEFHRRMFAHGSRKDGNVIVSSLTIGTAAPVADFTSCRWILEGLRLP